MDKIELIDRAAVIDTLRKLLESKWFGRIEASMYYRDSIEFAMSCINDAPTIDAAPVRRGEWVQKEIPTGYFTLAGNMPWVCSACEATKSWDLTAPADNFCPNCGADMRKEAHHEPED